MEILDIVDKWGRPTGEQVDRECAHALGIRHRTSHVWIVRKKDGRLQVLLQKRSREKDSYPGCYDISSAGHIPAGVDFIPSALRELKEELGYEAKAEELIFCGQRCFEFQDKFHGKLFRDNQVSNIYALWLDREPEEFTLQNTEVEEVRWFDFQECMEKVKKDQIPHCILGEELEMVQEQARMSWAAHEGSREQELYERFEFRDIRLEEVEQAAEIEQICFPPNEACIKERVYLRAEKAPDLFLVAVDKQTGRIAGFLNGLATDEDSFRDEFFTEPDLHNPNGKNIMLLSLAVLPQYRGQGLASAIMHHFLHKEQEEERGIVLLTCLESKVGMYKKMGFRDEGIANSSWGEEQWHEMGCVLH